MARARHGSPTPAQDAAPDPCEQHWAFDAIAAPVRRATLSLAESRAAHLASVAALDPKELESIAALSTAYDLAAGERFDTEVSTPDWPTRAPDTARELALSAERALALLIALPLPEEPEAVGMRRVHVAALAVIAGQPETFTAWRTVLRDTGRLRASTGLDLVWETLLVEQHLHDPEALRERIAHLREELTAAPARAAGLDRAMRSFARLNLVTAAGDLLTYRVRGAPTNLLSRLAQLMQDARRGTPGDRAMRAMLVWLAYAVAAVVAPRNDELSLPSV